MSSNQATATLQGYAPGVYNVLGDIMLSTFLFAAEALSNPGNKTKSYIINISLAINVGSIRFLLFIIGTCGLAIVSIIHRSSQLDVYTHLRVLYDDVYGRLSGLASLLTNTIATSLIGWKAWEHRQILRQGLGVSKGRWNTPSMKMLSLLVESGMLYCAMLAVAAAEVIVTRSNPSLASSTEFVSLAKAFLDGGCFVQILAIYSTTIIFIVALNWSLIEGTLVQNASPSAIPTHILPSALFRSSNPSIVHASRGTVRSGSFRPDSESASDSPENASTDD
ncbi:hypothetical protein LXA43DRAFT_1064703 [Ganoderma leucocontextum]|nr:hypothetical protein LXA43DRAFT_1064703 [Ganoderma leucocontextum]